MSPSVENLLISHHLEVSQAGNKTPDGREHWAKNTTPGSFGVSTHHEWLNVEASLSFTCCHYCRVGGSGLLRKIKVNVSRLDGSSDRETNGICDFPSLQRSSSASEKVHVPHATVFVNYQQQKKREKSRLDFNDINISMITISN